ncbi:MAG TPA: cupin domain-containing protein [Gemmatimonadaceae bacterium]|nr:cupin domain-containing protein [Gemmatimonadaceae bacterium]
MLRSIYPAAIAMAIALPFAQSGAQAPAAAADTMKEIRGSAVAYAPVDVPGFTKGMQLGVLNGDPSKPAPYTVRLKFPAGYAFPAHFHPNAENVTVVSGRFLLGMGDRVNQSALKSYAPGDFLSIPARHPHFGRVEGETVIQLHGIGPFEIMLAQPAAGGGTRE